MKQFVLSSFLLVLSLCIGQEFEEIHGIKIGASIAEVENIQTYMKKEYEDGTQDYKRYEFPAINLIVIDGIVEVAVFRVLSDTPIDFEVKLAEAALRWGVPNTMEITNTGSDFSLMKTTTLNFVMEDGVIVRSSWMYDDWNSDTGAHTSFLEEEYFTQKGWEYMEASKSSLEEK